MTLQEYFNANPKGRAGLIWWSGFGVSAPLRPGGRRAGAALFCRDPVSASLERRDAAQLCSGLGLPLKVLALDVLADAQVRRNPPERCYYCKRKIFSCHCRRCGAGRLSPALGRDERLGCCDGPPWDAGAAELQVQSPLPAVRPDEGADRAGAKAAGLRSGTSLPMPAWLPESSPV